MSDLAYNGNGEPFEVPPTTAAWRVRKLKPKGAPEVVYGRDGLPLFLALDADIEDLRREARAEGRYRLDPVDDHNRPLPNAQSSYVCVPAVEREREPAHAPVPVAASQADMTAQLVAALLESQKQHTEMARMYVAQFPVLVNALSGVVRSAGDAGLPARVPLVVPVAAGVQPATTTADATDDDDEDNEDEDEDEDDIEEEEIELVESVEPEWSWPKFAATAMERLSPQIDMLLGQLPALGARLSGRRSKPADPSASASPPAADPAAHMAAILAALPPKEAEAALALANELSLADKLQYFQTLSGMSVPEAVGYVRTELAKRGRNAARGAVEPDADEPRGPDVGMSDAQIDAHIRAIRGALTPDQSETVRVMLEELAFEHRAAWIESLCRMSVSEGAIFLGKKLAEVQRGARARSEAEPRIVRTPEGATPEATTVPAATRRASASVQPRRDGRRVVGSPVPSGSSPTTPTAHTDGAPTAELSPTSPQTQAHLTAIQNALTPAEDAAVRAYLAALPMPERSAWIGALLSLPVPEAVAMIRAQQIVDCVNPAPTPDVRASAPTAPSARESAPRNVAASMPAALPPSAASPAAIDAVPVPATTPPRSVAPAPTALAAVPPATEAPVPESGPDAAPSMPPMPPMPASPVEVSAHTHLIAIEQSLTAGERFLVHAQVAQMSPEDRESLLDQLVGATVPDGAAILRAAIRDLTAQAAPLATPAEIAPVVGPSISSARAGLDDAVTLDVVELLDDNAEQPDGEPLEQRVPFDDQEQDDAIDDQEPDADTIVEPREPASGSGAERSRADTPAAMPSDGLPTLAPETIARFQAIDAALTLAERMRVAELGSRLSPAELRRWITELTALSTPDAIAKIRAALAAADDSAGLGRKGGVS